jgi:WD40 repeat protein
MHIISGSADNTIQVWDAGTGDGIVRPLEGHTYRINSVTFSPDGKYIALGSYDKKNPSLGCEDRKMCCRAIRVTLMALQHILDIVIGSTLLHSHRTAGAKHIASGFANNTIRIWDAETGDVVGPLNGHAGRVDSVAFSQDGKHVVSGSYDHTIRVWDARNGVFAVGPLKGNTDVVKSVAFSQNDKHIISGSGVFPVGDDDLTGNFTDRSRLKGGWIHNSSLKLGTILEPPRIVLAKKQLRDCSRFSFGTS